MLVVQTILKSGKVGNPKAGGQNLSVHTDNIIGLMNYINESQSLSNECGSVMNVGIVPAKLTKPAEAEGAFYYVFTTAFFELAFGRFLAGPTTRTSDIIISGGLAFIFADDLLKFAIQILGIIIDVGLLAGKFSIQAIFERLH